MLLVFCSLLAHNIKILGQCMSAIQPADCNYCND